MVDCYFHKVFYFFILLDKDILTSRNAVIAISKQVFSEIVYGVKSDFGVCLFTDCFPVSSRVPAYAVMMNANFDTSRTAGS